MKYKTPILLIEDNPGDVDLLKIQLAEGSLKCDLLVADSFIEATKMLEEKEVELVLLDLSLPDISGFKTLTAYLNKFSRIPVIVLTGMNNEIIGNQSIKAGAQDFLVKGQFDAKLLSRSIRYALQRFKTHIKLEETAQELEIHKKRYVEAQEMAHFGNWEMDIVTNEMKWTAEIYRIMGITEGSLAPSLTNFLDYVHKDDRPKVEAFFEDAAKDGKMHKLEHRLLIDGISTKYVVAQAKVYYDEMTKKILLVGGLQDITERKLSEKLIIEKNITTKTESIKEEALAEMGFHIRTPLSSIMNLLYLLDNTGTTIQQKDFLNGLKTSVDDLSIATTNLLNFSVMVSDNVKIEAEEFKIQAFLKGIQKTFQLKADNAKLDLNLVVDGNLPKKLIADTNKITQILYNLINNAIKYTPEGGEILIHASAKNIQSNNLDLVLRVCDNGVGMSASKVEQLSKAEKLLEIYSEEEESIGKKKLGVAIVSKLTQTMNGQMSIESVEEEGTTVEIAIPVTAVKQTQMILKDKPEAPLKILLVEDHILNQIATKKVLIHWSDLVTVDIAENGLVAVEKYREHGYDLILMDIQMPVMNGIDSARRIRETSDVPIIALTANSTKQEQDNCFATGMNDYLSKPFKPEDLKAKIMGLISMVMN
jgi:CheY-like chemotaxis protein